MTKTLQNSFSPRSLNPSIGSMRRAFHRSVRLALHHLKRSAINLRHPLSSDSTDLALFMKKSKSLDLEFKKLRMSTCSSLLISQELDFKSVKLGLATSESKSSQLALKKIKGRNGHRRREGSRAIRKKTKGPSLKRLSILEFKQKKQLTNFFKSKQLETRELLKQTRFKPEKEGSTMHQPAGTGPDQPVEPKPKTALVLNGPAQKKASSPHFQNFQGPNKNCLLAVVPEDCELSRPMSRVFSLVRQESSTSKRRNFSSRDSKGLHQMSRSLIRLLSNHPSDSFSLDAICSKIQVEKRKIYDLINILTSIRMIDRISKGVYKWLGTQSVLSFLDSLPGFGELAVSLKAEKSLGSMCYCFLAFMKSFKESSIENAAESLTKSSAENKPVNPITFRSKIRRLYDISKILTTVGLIENLSENKKPIMKWVGALNMLRVVREISSSPEEVPLRTLDMRQMMEKLQNSLNNAVLTIPEAEMQRKRLESIDMGIVEKYLNNEKPALILPRVSVLIPEL